MTRKALEGTIATAKKARKAISETPCLRLVESGNTMAYWWDVMTNLTKVIDKAEKDLNQIEKEELVHE